MNVFSNLPKKEKFGLTIGIVIVLLALLDRIVMAPIGLQFKKVNSQIKANEMKLARDLRNLSQKDDIAREYQKYIQYVKSNYSEGEEVAKLLEEVEGIGSSTGITINNINPNPPKQIGVYKYYLIEIDAEGKMDALMAFLYNLGNSKQLFRASKVYISLKDKETSTVKASILVTKIVVP